MRHTKHPTRSVTRQTDVFTLQRGRGLPPSSSHASPLFTETDFDGHVSQVSPPPTNPKPPSNPLTSRHCRREGGGEGVERDVSHNLNLKCQHGSVLHHQSLSWNHVPHPSRSPPGCQRLSYDAIMSTVRIYAMNVPGPSRRRPQGSSCIEKSMKTYPDGQLT